MDKSDKWHQKAVESIQKRQYNLIITDTVLPEICYLINKYLGKEYELAVLNSVLKKEIKVEMLLFSDFKRIIEILTKYKEMNIGFVDASVVAIAERMKIKKLFTTDRRHFSKIKPLHCSYFELLP